MTEVSITSTGKEIMCLTGLIQIKMFIKKPGSAWEIYTYSDSISQSDASFGTAGTAPKDRGAIGAPVNRLENNTIPHREF